MATGRIEFTYVPTAKMVADELTKHLTHAKFDRFLQQKHLT